MPSVYVLYAQVIPILNLITKFVSQNKLATAFLEIRQVIIVFLHMILNGTREKTTFVCHVFD